MWLKTHGVTALHMSNSKIVDEQLDDEMLQLADAWGNGEVCKSESCAHYTDGAEDKRQVHFAKCTNISIGRRIYQGSWRCIPRSDHDICQKDRNSAMEQAEE